MRAVVFALMLLAGCGREGQPVASDTPPPATLPLETQTPEPTDEPSPTPDETPEDGASATPATPTAAAACRNSTVPSCGDFRFDPEASDDQIDVDVSYQPRSPKAGDRVTFTLRARDPDSSRVFLGTYEFTEDGPGEIAKDDFGKCPRAFGPWDPPREQGGSATKILSHTYEEAGTFEATFTFFSHSYERSKHPWPNDPPGDREGRCIDPYASSGKADVTLRVSE